MKPKIFAACMIALVAFFAYKLFVPSKVEVEPVSAQSEVKAVRGDQASDEALPEPAIRDVASNRPPVPSQSPSETSENNGEADIREVRSPEADNPDATIIEVKAPAGSEGRPAIVSLVSEDQKTTPEREPLPDVKASFDSGNDAVQVFGEQLAALNGTYVGEIVREGKEPCSATIVIDGTYSPAEGQNPADFKGNFVLSFECVGTHNSHGRFNGNFGQSVKAIGENSKALLMRDGGGNFFQLSFSSDYQRVSGPVYASGSGTTLYLGRLTAQR